MLPDKDKWLDTAVSDICFAPDRQSVREELEGHIEDRAADLRRVFPDIPEEEALSRALAGMGDAEELKVELARIHRPWMGWLWKLSQVILAVVLLLEVFFLFRGGRNFLWGRAGPEVYCPIRDGETARVGGYTFRIMAAAYVDRPEVDGAVDTLQVVLRASSPRFWERVNEHALLESLCAVAPDGERYDMDRQVVRHYTITDGLGNTATCQMIESGGRLCRWGLDWKEVAIQVPAEGWKPGDRVTLELDSPVGNAELSAPVTEKVMVK